MFVTIKAKLIGIILSFIVIIGSINVSTLIVASMQKADAGIINLSGIQRMLYQKYTKGL